MPVRVKVPPKAKKSTSPNRPIFQYESGVPLDSLNLYHKNPRVGNVEKVAESLRENGQYKTIVVNVGTYTGRPQEVLAGNHTVLGARSLDWETIDVGWVDVTEEHARRIVLADNGSTDDAGYDEDILAALLKEQDDEVGTLVGTTYTDDLLKGLMVELNPDPLGSVDMVEDAPDDLDGVRDLNNFVMFESDADFDIPQLRLDMIPEKLPVKLDTWAGHELDGPRQDAEPERWWLGMWHSGCRGINWRQTILGMYTEDFHFLGVFEDPAQNTKKILNLGIPWAIMPNYSVNEDYARATWIWSAYRSAYVGRYWQEAGIQVIPDIQYGMSDEALYLTLQCVPKGAPVVAAQVQNARGDDNKIRTAARLLKKAEKEIGWNQLLLYGHTDADRVMEYAKFDSEVVRVDNRTSRRREYLDTASMNGRYTGKQRRSPRSTGNKP